jgi:hypothetical protein
VLLLLLLSSKRKTIISMEWELSKENVQPLRKGRKVEVLNEALKCKEAGAVAVNNLENQRRFVALLRAFFLRNQLSLQLVPHIGAIVMANTVALDGILR